MRPPHPNGSVKDLSKERADSKKNVTQSKAKLSEEFAREQAERVAKAERTFDRGDALVRKLKSLDDLVKDDASDAKKVVETGENIAEALEKAVKDMVKVHTQIKTSSGTIEVGPPPPQVPPGAGDIAALALWVAVWLQWVRALKSKL